MQHMFPLHDPSRPGHDPARVTLDHRAGMSAGGEAPLAEARGLFGPGSASWQVDRELIVLAGGSCALLLQAAHPVVAAGVADHSTYATDPFGRLMRTLSSSFDVVFGTRSQAGAAIRRINAIHAAVEGELPDGHPYRALDPEPLLWVHATLVDTALRVYRRFVGPIKPERAQAYHDEARVVAELLGVPADGVPPTLVELRDWMNDMVSSGRVGVTPQARTIARTILHPLPHMPDLVAEAMHLVSLSILRPDIRAQYGIGWSPARADGMRRLAALSRLVLPSLPSPFRLLPVAREAERRVHLASGSTA